VLGGVLLSNSAFVLAACCLYALGVEVLRDRRLAWRGALLFCCTPASVFFSSLYTESRHPPLQPEPSPSPSTHPEPNPKPDPNPNPNPNPNSSPDPDPNPNLNP